jgi:tRNA-binding protein
MDPISWGDFERVELRAGTVLEVREFPAARKPAYQLRIDFGPLGERWSSAQITTYYDAESLVGKQVLAVLNFPPKQVAGFKSEVLVTGFVLEDGSVVLAQPERPVPNGSKLA